MLCVVAGSSLETYRVAALVEAAENAATFVLASLVSGYKRYLFLTRRSSRHILLGRLRFKVNYLLVQLRVCCCANPYIHKVDSVQEVLVPFKLLKEKVPFLEYLFRMIIFCFRPFIPREQLGESNLRYAFVDYVLSFTVALLIITLLPANNNELSYRQIISIFNFEWLSISFLYYSIVQFCFIYVVYLLFFKYRAKSNSYKKDAYYSSLHFVRFHSIVVLLSILGIMYVLSACFNKGIMLNQFEDYFTSLPYAKVLSISFLVGIFWLYIFPMSLFIYYKSTCKTLFRYLKGILVVFLIYSLSFFLNGFMPSKFIGNVLDISSTCEVLMKSPIKKIHPEAYKESEWNEKCI